MNQVKTLYHRALMYKEWRNSRGLILGLLGLIIYTYPLTLLLGLSQAASLGLESAYLPTRAVINRIRMASIDGTSFLIILAVVILAAWLIAEERRRSTIEFLLAMPFSRAQIVFNKYLLGVGAITATCLVNGLMLAAIITGNAETLAGHLDIGMVVSWAAAQAVVLTLVFSFTMVSATIAAGILPSVIFSVIFMAFPAGLAALLRDNVASLLGLSYHEATQALAFLRVADDITLLNYFTAREAVLSRWPILVLTSLVLLWVAARLFEENPMERRGELLMFPGLEIVLRIGVTVCTMLLFGSVIMDYHGGMTPLIVIRYVIGGLVGWFITHFAIAWSKAGR